MTRTKRTTAMTVALFTALGGGLLTFDMIPHGARADSADSLATPKAEMLAQYLQEARSRTAQIHRMRGHHAHDFATGTQNTQPTATPTLTAEEQREYSNHLTIAQERAEWRNDAGETTD